ncbi:MAG: 2OG-Fe(II) oxygenase [Legionellaceae bacterium]|nr:2OG-Fe(II) oxygenase [Legionellaceae bacterium]
MIENNLVETGFHIIDDFLDRPIYQLLCQQAQTTYQSGHFKAANVGRATTEAHKPTIRNDDICWLDPDPNNSPLLTFYTAIEQLRTQLNQSLFLGLNHFESHFAVYQPGKFYKKHIDQFKTNKERRISCVYYLNETWQPSHGGELIIYNQNEEIISQIEPMGNRFICFNSTLLHEVLTTHHTRYSIAGWLKTRS